MEKLFFIHWNQPEAEYYAGILRDQGYSVEIEWKDGSYAGKRINEGKPSGIIISLIRSPKHGIATAKALQRMSMTRQIPLVFFGGSPAAVKMAQENVEGAEFLPEAEGMLKGFRFKFK